MPATLLRITSPDAYVAHFAFESVITNSYLNLCPTLLPHVMGWIVTYHHHHQILCIEVLTLQYLRMWFIWNESLWRSG
jgi:hypothetical protein